MYKGINEFKEDCQHRAYVMKNDDSTIVADTTSIFSRLEQFIIHLLNFNQSSGLERSEIYSYTVESDIPEHSPYK